jgi:CRISPR-associated protein Csy1
MSISPAAGAALERARAAFANGDMAATFASAADALADAPNSLEARVLRINAALKLERWGDAIAALEPLAASQPAASKLHRTLGACWWHVGAACKAEGNADAALAAWRQSLGADPDRHDVRRNLAELLLDRGEAAEAIQLARQSIGTDGLAVAWAIRFCRRLRRNSDLAASTELLTALRERARDAAVLLSIDLELAHSLPAIYPDRATQERLRGEFIDRLGRFVEAYSPERVASIAPLPDTLLVPDNFYLAYQGENDREPQRLFGGWLTRSLAPLLPLFKPSPRRSGKPRLAMVSSRFHECTVGAYFASWVAHLAGTGWELILVHIGDYRDALTERLAAHAHQELTLAGDIVDNSTKLHDLAADLILYPELGMDYRTFGLAALRLAPVQVCAWGHPVTTGLPSIDAYLSCAAMEPADAAEHYTERLLTLPGLGTRYLSPEITAPLARALLGLPERGTLYLVPQSAFKLHPDNDRLFVEVVQRDADARLVFFGSIEAGALRAFRARLDHALGEAGIDAAAHVLFLPECSRADYLRVNQACDVMLDSLHWSGGNTSLDALHCGLPIVTCPGRFMRGRQSMAMLQGLDCAELIVERPRQLAELAVEIANDRTHRNGLAAKMRANLPALTQSEAPLQALDAILKNLIAQS